MNDNSLRFTGNIIYFDTRRIDTDYPVKTAFRIEDKIIVLYDPDSDTKKFGQFPNLIAFSLQGEKLWIAKLPTNESGDAYVEIESTEPLVAYSWKGFHCSIDISNGKILEKRYVR